MELLTGTSEENFKQALQQEELMLQCGPGDPYFRIAKKNVEWYLDVAARIERGEKTTTNVHSERF